MEWDSTRILNHPDMAYGGGGFYYTSMTPTPHGLFCSSPKTGSLTAAFYFLDAATRSWKKIPIKTSVAIPDLYLDKSGVCYDEKRDRMILVIGGALSDIAEVYSFSFKDSTFVRIVPAHASTATGTKFYREAIYLPNQDKMLFECTVTGGNLLFNCATNDWETVKLARGAGLTVNDDLEGSATGLMYDKKRNLVWNVGQACEVYVMRPDTSLGTSSEVITYSAQPLLKVSPNPFSLATSIAVNHASPCKLQVNILDISGRIVKTLFSGNHVGGIANYQWNGKGVNQKAVAPGVYFVRVKAGEQTINSRLMIMR
jgi:hypothetical protein